MIGKPCDHSVFPLDPITGKHRPWGVYYAKGDNIPNGGRTFKTDEEAHEGMGIVHRTVPWEFLCEGLPPAYTYWVGKQLKAAV